MPKLLTDDLRTKCEKLIETANRVALDARNNAQIAGTSLWQPCFADVTDKVVDSMNEVITLVRQSLAAAPDVPEPYPVGTVVFVPDENGDHAEYCGSIFASSATDKHRCFPRYRRIVIGETPAEPKVEKPTGVLRKYVSDAIDTHNVNSYQVTILLELADYLDKQSVRLAEIEARVRGEKS